MMNTIIVPRDIRQLPKVLPPPSYDAPRPPAGPSASDLPSPKDQDQAPPLARQKSAPPAVSAQPSSKEAPAALRNGQRVLAPFIPQPRAIPGARGYYAPNVIPAAAGVPSNRAVGLPPIQRQGSADQLLPGVRPGPRRVSCS